MHTQDIRHTFASIVYKVEGNPFAQVCFGSKPEKFEGNINRAGERNEVS